MTCLSESEVADLVGGLMAPATLKLAEQHLRACKRCEANVRDSRERLLAVTMSPRQIASRARARTESFETNPSITAPGPRRDLPEVGHRLANRYTLERCLGRGGMGVVFEAEDEVLHGKVAVKLLANELARQRAFVEQLHQEIRVGRRITSPRVCRIHDLGTDGDLHFVVMERVDGETLEARIRRAPLTPEEIASVLDQLCEALIAAHGEGVVHRDLKPANVMIDSEGRIKVMDFGLARDLRVESNHYSVPKGTPAYWAPEQARGEHATESSDLYAVGMICLDLFSGKFPWERSPDAAIATIPSAYRDVVLRCLSMDPAQRVKSAVSLREELRRAHRAGRPIWTRRGWVMAAAGTVAVGVGVGTVLMIAGSKEPEPRPRPPIASPPAAVHAEPARAPAPSGVPSSPVEAPTPKPPPPAVMSEKRMPRPLHKRAQVETSAEAARTDAAFAAELADLERRIASKHLLSSDVPGLQSALTQLRAPPVAGKPSPERERVGDWINKVDAVTVDAKFVSEKLQRLTSALKQRNPPPDRARPIYALFERVQAAYFKGDYATANDRLNEVSAAIDQLER